MKYIVIGAFDALIERAMPIQCIQPMLDEDIKESHRRAVIAGAIPAKTAQNLVIFKYGYFDDENGEFELLDKPLKIVALADFLPRKNEEVNKSSEAQPNA